MLFATLYVALPVDRFPSVPIVESAVSVVMYGVTESADTPESEKETDSAPPDVFTTTTEKLDLVGSRNAVTP